LRTNKNNKYTDLKARSEPEPSDINGTFKLTFKLKSGREQAIDLTFFVNGSHRRTHLAEIFAWYFRKMLRGARSSTRETQLYVAKKFNHFLDWRAEGSGNVSTGHDITTDVLLEYQMWLVSAGGVIEKTADHYYKSIAAILNNVLINRPEDLCTGLKIPPNCFSSAKHAPNKTPVLSIEDLKKIHAAALKDVTEIRKTHDHAKRLLAEGEEHVPYTRRGSCKLGYWKSPANALFYIVNQAGINNSPRINRVSITLLKHGLPTGHAILGMYVPTSPDSFIPFLILLFVHTAINVESLFHLKRDCLKEHALPLNLTVLEFEKPRSAPDALKRLLFPSRQMNGVVDLISFLLEYTAPLVSFARASEDEELFLYKAVGCGKGEIRSPGANFSLRALNAFIKRHELPNFTFAQIRPTIATIIYLHTRDIFRVQRLLCHTSVAMTINYIKQEVTRRQHDTEIRDGIASFMASIVGDYPQVGKPSVFPQPAETVLRSKITEGEISPEQAAQLTSGGCSTGLARCKDPLNSPIPGEKAGRVCTQLHMCIFCPNAWIFEEDLPKVIYTRDSILADRKMLTDSLWDRLHGAAFHEIQEEILPSFSEKSITSAAAKARELFKPYPI
jgi:hypothetical protein